MSDQEHELPLIQFLLKLNQKQDRGALAALRSGRGKQPGESARMFPYVAGYLKGGGADSPQVQAVFLTASLFASHPSHASKLSLGASLRLAVKAKHGEDGVAARLTSTLDADPEDLPRRVTELVGLCESASVPLDWSRFYWDVLKLLGEDDESRNRTRLQWARDFWGHPQDDTQQTEPQESKP